MQQQHRPLLPVANNLMLAASTTSSSGHFGYTNSSYLGGDGSPLNADLSLSSSSGGGGGSALMTTTPSGAVVQQSLKNNHHQPTSKSRAGVHSITPGRHQPSQPVNRQSTEGQSPVYQDDADPYARPPGPMAVKSRSNHQHQLSSASTVTVGINDDGLGQSRDQLVMPTTLSSNPYNTELSLASTANSHFIDSSDMSGQQHQWSFPPQHSHQQQSTSRQHQPPHHPSRQRRIRQNVVQQPPQYDTPPIVYARQPQLFTNGSRNGDDASLYQGVPQGQWPPSSSSSRRRHPQQPSSSLSIQSASSSSNTSQSVAFANNRLLVNGTNQSAANWAKMHHQQSGGGGGHLPINHHHAANLPTTTRIPDLLVHQQNVKSSPKRSPQPPINNIAPSSPRGGDSRHHLTAVSSTSIADLARKSSNKTTVCAPRPIDAVQRLIGQFASSSSDKRQAKQHASQSRVRQTTAAARSGSKTTKPGASDSRNVDQDDERETTALCLTTGDLKLTNTKAALAGMLGIGGGGGGAKRKARRKLQQASNVDKS